MPRRLAAELAEAPDVVERDRRLAEPSRSPRSPPASRSGAASTTAASRRGRSRARSGRGSARSDPAGSKRMTRFQSVYTSGASAIGVPGWPELAACTASIDSVRMVLMASWSSCVGIESWSFRGSSWSCLRVRRATIDPSAVAISSTTERAARRTSSAAPSAHPPSRARRQANRGTYRRSVATADARHRGGGMANVKRLPVGVDRSGAAATRSPTQAERSPRGCASRRPSPARSGRRRATSTGWCRSSSCSVMSEPLDRQDAAWREAR